jgi:hypothetical protein
MLLRPVFLTLKPLVPRCGSYPEYTLLHRDTQAAVSRNSRGFFHYCLIRDVGRAHKRLAGAACSL